LLMASEGAGAVGPTLGEMDLDEFRLHVTGHGLSRRYAGQTSGRCRH
jgi:hypothetical protein